MSDNGREESVDPGDDLQVVLPQSPRVPAPPEVSYRRPDAEPTASGATRPRASILGGKPVNQADRDSFEQNVQGYGIAITAGLTVIITVLGFVALGQLLDHKFHPNGTPWYTVVGLLLGVVGGFYNMFRLLLSTGKIKK